MTTRPATWIQVLNFQGRACIGDCLESLLRAARPAGTSQVVVVDNASDDGSREFVESTFPQVPVIRSRANLGFAGGNNLGLRVALDRGYDHAILINMDTTVASDCLEVLVDVAQNRPDAALVGATICSADGGLVEFDGRQFDRVLTAGGYADTTRDQEQADRQPRRAAYACGAGMLMRLDAIKTIGMFSPYFFAYHEDVELALRCRLFGYEVLCAPSALVFHSRGGAGAGERFRDFMGTRNLVLTLLKIYDRHTWEENSGALLGHFAAPDDGLRFQAALAAVFDAPSALRDRRRLRREALRSYRDILGDLASIAK